MPEARRGRWREASRRKVARLSLALALATAALATVTLATLPAAAEPTAQDTATARKLYFDGEAKRRAGDVKGAQRAFLAAEAILSVPTTALKLAEADIELGLLVEAHEALERAIRFKGTDPVPEAFTRAQASARELREKLRPRIPSLIVVVSGDGESARAVVTVDGRPLPQAARSLPLLVNPGRHTVAVTYEGHAPVEKEVAPLEGAVETLTFEAPAAPVAPPVAPPAAPPSGPPPSPLPPTTTTTPPSTTPARRTGGGPLLYGSAIVSGVGLVAGAVTGVMTLTKASDLERRCNGGLCAPASHGTLREADTLATVSTIGFVVAGVGAAVFVGALVLAPRGDDPARTASRARLARAALGHFEF